MLILRKLKQRLLFALERRGWYRHVKEKRNYLGTFVFATKGTFFRHDRDNRWLYALSRHHHNIMDIGCNIGQSTWLMQAGTDNRVVCVDPNPKALAFCAENMIFNGMSARVSFVNAFVGDQEGLEIPFYTVGTGAAGSMFSGFAHTAKDHSQSMIVKTRTVTGICKELNFVPDFIKIDVEGAEQLVLKGIGPELLASKPMLFVEMHSGDGLSILDNTNAILIWCETNGYRAYYMRDHQPLLVDRIVKRGRYHALLISQDATYPEYLTSIPEGAPLP